MGQLAVLWSPLLDARGKVQRVKLGVESKDLAIILPRLALKTAGCPTAPRRPRPPPPSGTPCPRTPASCSHLTPSLTPTPPGKIFAPRQVPGPYVGETHPLYIPSPSTPPHRNKPNPRPSHRRLHLAKFGSAVHGLLLACLQTVRLPPPPPRSLSPSRTYASQRLRYQRIPLPAAGPQLPWCFAGAWPWASRISPSTRFV